MFVEHRISLECLECRASVCISAKTRITVGEKTKIPALIEYIGDKLQHGERDIRLDKLACSCCGKYGLALRNFEESFSPVDF